MRTARWLPKAAALVVVVLLAAPTLAADKALLRSVFKANDRYLAVMSTDQEIAQTLPNGQVMKITQVMRMEMGMKVMSVTDDGTGEIEVTYDRVALKQDSPYGRLDYDSGDPAKKDVNHPALAGFKPLLGKSLRMTMTNRGEVKRVTGMKAIMESILEGVPAGADREAAEKQLAKMLDEEHFSSQMSGFGIPLPQEPVGVGDTWSHDIKTGMGFMSMLVRTKYKVEKITDDAVELSLQSTIEKGDEVGADLPMSIVVEEGSTQSGTSTVQRANAVLNTSDLKQVMKMVVTVQGQTMKQQVTGRTAVTVKPDTRQ